MEKKTWHFDFLIEGFTRKQADLLLSVIELYAMAFEVTMAGGFHEESEADDDEETE